jgi:hypothetical protein
MNGQSLDHVLVSSNIDKLYGAEVNVLKPGLEAVHFHARAGQADNVLSALFLPVGDPIGGRDDPSVERRYRSSPQDSMQLHPSLPVVSLAPFLLADHDMDLRRAGQTIVYQSTRLAAVPQ